VSKKRDVSIRLTAAQIAQVVRETSGKGRGVTSLLTTLSDLSSGARAVDTALNDVRYSRCTLRAPIVLAAFPHDGSYRPMADVAKELADSPSATHRYATTWLGIGALEQDPSSRQYRRPS
jgi:hypothetical protein